MGFELYVVCNECGSNMRDVINADFANSFDHYICSKCGSRGKFKDVIKKWVSTSVLFKPSTWGTGYWIDSKGNIL